MIWTWLRDGSYSYQESPTGTVNAWSESNAAVQAAITGPSAGVTYCSNAAYDYEYKATASYSAPDCMSLPVDEVVTKGIGSISFTTHVIETVELGWSCEAASTDEALAKQRKCTDHHAVKPGQPNQCYCASQRHYFVQA